MTEGRFRVFAPDSAKDQQDVKDYEYFGHKVAFRVFFPVYQNLVVAVGAEGWFHLFDLTAATASKSDSSSQHEFLSSEDQRPFFTQHIPANTKVILISDIGKFRFDFSIYYVCFLVHLYKSDYSVYMSILEMVTAAVSWWSATQIGWCELFVGRSRLMGQMWDLDSWSC